MKSREQLCIDVLELAKNNVVSIDILNFSLKKGEELAESYHASKEIVFIGLCLMDLKLQEARALGDLKQHVAMGSAFAKDFLKNYDITTEEFNKIIHCIEAHHKEIPFECIEAEICVNADCYLFIHPVGVLHYLNLWATRTDNLIEQVTQVKLKLEEKYRFISLDKAKSDLEEYYQMFLKIFDEILL